MKAINLTQHVATAEQIASGVIEPESWAVEKIKELLTFDAIPSAEDMESRADDLAEIVWMHEGVDYAMIGGAPFFMAFLENALKDRGIKPIYAFSRRESVEQTMPDGTVRKINVFKHLGFVGM